MDRVLIVVRAFEDFAVGDMIIEDGLSGSGLADEHRHNAVAVSAHAPVGNDPEET